MYMSPCYRENIPIVFYTLVLHLTVSNARLINMHFTLRLGLRYIHFDKNKISTSGIIDIFCTSVFGIEKTLERCSDVLGHLLISCTDFVLFFTYMYLSMMVLKLASININGLRSNLKQSSVKDFILQNKPDILLLQETFVDN